MIHSEEKPGGRALLIIAILLLMAAMLGALLGMADAQGRQTARVWVPEQQAAGGAP